MKKMKPISKEEFFQRFNVKEIDHVKKGLFTQKDIDELVTFTDGLTHVQKIFLLPRYLLFALKNPRFISTFVLPKLGFAKEDLLINRHLSLQEQNPVKNCILKSSIAAAFDPKIILEIGTYLG